MTVCNYLFKILQKFWFNFFITYFFIHSPMDTLAETHLQNKRCDNCDPMEWVFKFPHINMHNPLPPYEVLNKSHSVGLSVRLCRFASDPRNFFFALALAYMYHVWHMGASPSDDVMPTFMTPIWPNLWPQGQIYKVFDMVLCSGHSFFVLLHILSWLVCCHTLGNMCECHGSS